jgi:hypothetical protein
MKTQLIVLSKLTKYKKSLLLWNYNITIINKR